MNGSRVIPKMAGIESVAKTRSVTSTVTRTRASGVATILPPCFRKNLPDSYPADIGTIRRKSLTTGFCSGSTSVSPSFRILPPREYQKGAKNINDPMESANQRCARNNKRRPHDKGAQNTPEENPMMQPWRNAKIAEQDDKDKNIVDTQRIFDQISGKKLQSVPAAGCLCKPKPQGRTTGKSIQGSRSPLPGFLPHGHGDGIFPSRWTEGKE